MKPGKLFEEFEEAGARKNRVTIFLNDLELEHLDALVDRGRNVPAAPSRSDLLRWGFLKLLQDHGFPVWEDDNDE